MTFEETIIISQDEAKKIQIFLEEEPSSEEKCLGEDETISYTASFNNGFEMDIKCCGVQYQEGESNLAWTEAVLFQNGVEICCTEPSDEFIGDWNLWDDENEYIVHVIVRLDEQKCDKDLINKENNSIPYVIAENNGENALKFPIASFKQYPMPSIVISQQEDGFNEYMGKLQGNSSWEQYWQL